MDQHGTVKLAFNKKQMKFINLVRRCRKMKYIEMEEFIKATDAQKANYCKRIAAGEIRIKEVSS